MKTTNITPVREAWGTVESAPFTNSAKGFAFITTDDGLSVYCHPALVRLAGISGADIGRRALVRYQSVTQDRYTAVEAKVLREPNDASPPSNDQHLADIVARIDEHLNRIDALMDDLTGELEARGCTWPGETVD